VQKPVDAVWLQEAERIYAGYEIYAQSGGSEQAVFNRVGVGQCRSASILSSMADAGLLAEQGRLLDIGCGAGGLLCSMHVLRPDWQLSGTEWSSKHKRQIESLPNTHFFEFQDPVAVPGQFDLITMVHVFEHVPDPVRLLRRLVRKMLPGGRLLIQVPNWRQNPFDLVVADHCAHFTPDVLAGLVVRAGWRVLLLETHWVSKEISLVAEPCLDGTSGVSPDVDPVRERIDAEAAVDWLRRTVVLAREGVTRGPLALFGTSIAANWLFQELDGQVQCFVDEDRRLTGCQHLGREILHPRKLQGGMTLFMALPSVLSRPIMDRLYRPDLTFLTPPKEPWQ
jgi:2-polyprenyl-3-methyl-5-hydroxy-6-metoxy-1,4-benzoquinol methylase